MTTLDKNSFLEWQYHTLRKEIETSKDRHFKITAGTLIIVPTIELLAVGAKAILIEEFGAVTILSIPILVMLLILPIVVLLLYVLYLSEHCAITRCALYIRNVIEPAVPEVVGWEEWLGETWLERTAARSTSSLPGQLRVHEDLQMLGFALLYHALYVVAAATTGFVVGFAVYQVTHEVFTSDEVIPVLAGGLVGGVIVVGLGVLYFYMGRRVAKMRSGALGEIEEAIKDGPPAAAKRGHHDTRDKWAS